MDFSLYGDDSKGIVKLDPRTKMLIFLVSASLSLSAYRLAPILIYGTVLCIVLALCGKKGLALKAYLGFTVALFLRFCIETSGTGNEVVVFVLSGVISILLFGFPIALSFVLLVQTTRISHFLSAFAAMHLPAFAVIPVAVLFRFIPTVQEEWNGIKKAMAFRGITVDLASVVKAPLRTVEYVLIPLLFSSISVMEELAAAALARGMDSDKHRTSYEEVRLGAADFVALVVFASLAVYVALFGK